MLGIGRTFLRGAGRIELRRFQSGVQCTEIRIPVPWGHIAGKWWGPQDKRPIVTLHGWQDNCGSFDLLIPILPKHLSFLTLDFPGHGYSSKYPAGMFYHGINSSIMLRYIQKYFNWNKISLMGHSLGAISSYTHGFIYPNDVDFCICIDGLHPLINSKRIDRVQRSIEEFMKYDEQFTSASEPPTYTMEEMEQRLHLGTRKSIDLDKCKYILERNVKPAKEPGRYYFDRDPRLKCGPLITFAQEALLEATARVKFPIYLSKAELSPFFDNKKYFEEVLKVLRLSSKDCQYFDVPGRHHGHLNTPEIFKEIIPAFIEKHDIEDRSMGGLKKEMVL